MPRVQEGTTYRLADGRWGIQYRDEHGTRQRQSPFRREASAKRWLRDVEIPRQLGLGEPEPVERLTLDEHCSRFLRVHPCSKARRRALRSSLGPARETFGDRLLDDIATGEIAEWASTRGRAHVIALKQVLRAAADWGLVERSPAAPVRVPVVHAEEVAAFTDTEEVDLVADELGPPWGTMIVVWAETGLRPQEIVALERSDVDRRSGVLLVRRSYTVDEGLKQYGKTSRSRRSVPLSDRALAALDGLATPILTPILFPTYAAGRTHGEPGHLNLRNWRRRQWTPALRAAGLSRDGEPWLPKPYALRHTFATWALEAGCDLFRLARVMGTSVAMIDRTYGHLSRDHAVEMRDLLNRRPSLADADEARDDAKA